MEEFIKEGCSYENRKNGKIGKVVSIDATRHIVTLRDADNKNFDVSMTVFKANWSKIKSSDIDDSATVDTMIDDVVSGDNLVCDTESFGDIIDYIKSKRNVDALNHGENHVDIIVDGLSVLTALSTNNKTSVECYPDLYTYSSVREYIIPGTLKFNLRKLGKTVEFDTALDFDKLLAVLKQAIIELNLYGYIAN